MTNSKKDTWVDDITPAGAFVERDVHCQCPFIEEILSNPDIYEKIDDFQDIHTDFWDRCNEIARERVIEEEEIDTESEEYQRGDLDDEIEQLKENYWPDVYEYWLVDPFLGSKLHHYGEIVLFERPSNIWCRQTTGQAIKCDRVIHKIYRTGIDNIKNNPNHPYNK